MCSGLLASVSLIKGENPDQSGIFAGDYEYRIGFAAADVLRVARAIASPIRAEYAVHSGVYAPDGGTE
jgi:hypothetical protein